MFDKTRFIVRSIFETPTTENRYTETQRGSAHWHQPMDREYVCMYTGMCMYEYFFIFLVRRLHHDYISSTLTHESHIYT
jgi:hypothetical protein